MNPALQFLELVDKNAINIFKEFIDMYKVPLAPKVRKERKVAIKVKPIKEPKPVKEKPVKEKPVKEKPVKPKKVINALDILMDIKSGKIPKSKVKRNLELEIKQLIDTITESIESNKPEESLDEIFL